MIKYFILPVSMFFCGISAFGQMEETTQIEARDQVQQDRIRGYRGCTHPVSYQEFVRKTEIRQKEKEEEKQTIQKSLDITDPEMSQLAAAPNPTKGCLNISIPEGLIGKEIRVMDMTGRFVGSPIPITGTSENLTLKGKSGVYFLIVETEKVRITKRIILQK